MEKYFLRHLYNLPDYYTEAETNRLSIVYFCLAGLDALNALHLLDKLWIINHIYYHQVTSGGFTGSRHLGTQPGEDSLEQGNLAMTFAAITSLLILGDDLTRLNKEDLFRGVKDLQRSNGSFMGGPSGCESDVRFVYCACAISSLLNDWSAVDITNACQYVLSCISYEGGLGLAPGAEAQGGATYCGIAALVLMGRLESLSSDQLDRLRHWCLQRQVGGYQGRTGKAPDSCYSFWVGATQALIGDWPLVHTQSTTAFIRTQCERVQAYDLTSELDRAIKTVRPAVHTSSPDQEPIPITRLGPCLELPVCGCTRSHAKSTNLPPDILHSFYSLTWLRMSGNIGDGSYIDSSAFTEKDNRSFDVRFAMCADKLPLHLHSSIIPLNN